MVSVDGKVVINWKGDLSRLSFDSGAYRNVPDRRAMFLTTLQSYHVYKLELTPVSGTGKRVHQ